MPLHWRRQAVLSLLAGLWLSSSHTGLANTIAADTSFGRWESELRHCKLSWPREASLGAQVSSCLSVRLDQTIEGMLRVRFINASNGGRFASEELTFVGLLLKQDQPMQCSKGLCRPQWPMRLQVQGVATRRFDQRGVALRLPLNQLAQGSCQLHATNLNCKAFDPSGLRWTAVADQPQAQPVGRPTGRPTSRTP